MSIGLMSIREIIDFFDNNYPKEVFRNRNVSEDINQNIISIKDADKIVYIAYINSRVCHFLIAKGKYSYFNKIYNKMLKKFKKLYL